MWVLLQTKEATPLMSIGTEGNKSFTMSVQLPNVVENASAFNKKAKRCANVNAYRFGMPV
jgi:hypothetical protein